MIDAKALCEKAASNMQVYKIKTVPNVIVFKLIDFSFRLKPNEILTECSVSQGVLKAITLLNLSNIKVM